MKRAMNLQRVGRAVVWWSLGCGLSLVFSGCHSVTVTEPKRSVAEQLLLSTAADRAVEGVDLHPLEGKKVYLQEKYFDSYDKEYCLGAIRELISTNGAFLVDTVDDAEVIVEARSGGLGLDQRETLFGIPNLILPIPLVGNFELPEIALFKSTKADSIAKFALLAIDSESRAYLHSTGAMPGKSRFHHYKVLGIINWRRTDIPELKTRFFGGSD